MKSTKDLARELGLLRKRTCHPSNQLEKKAKCSAQLFDYLIVIDFESTCWQGAKHSSQEIIEFPAVLLNTRSGEVEAEFHRYVQPQENPILSDFCKQLTGISQDQVDNGIPLSLCLKQLARWLSSLSEKFGIVYNSTLANVAQHPCTFATWSDWDLGTCLHYECRRKQLRKPLQLNSWIDLRATYRAFYSRKPQGLNGALQEVGITFEGREHSGLHDARNTARLAWRMINDGCVMQITKSLTVTDPSSCTTSKWAAVNACEPTLQHCPLVTSSEFGPTTPSVNSVISVQHWDLRAQSPNDHHMEQKSEADEKSTQINQQNELTEPNPNSGLFCSEKTPTMCSGGSLKMGEGGVVTSKADIVTDNLLLYGFNAADWLDDSFTDEKSGTNTVTPMPCSVAKKNNNKCTRPRLKIYEDRSGSALQNVANQLSKNSNTKVLSDRTNVAHRASQMWTKNRYPVLKKVESFSVCKENDKPGTCGPSKTCGVNQRASVIDCDNSAKNGLKLLSQSADRDIKIRVSKTCSEVYSNASHSAITALSSTTVNGARTQLQSAVTEVTASCKISAIVTSSVLVLTSSAVTFHSSMTSVVGSHMSVPNAVTYASSVSSITVCNTVLISESTKHQTVGSCRPSFSCSAAVPQLCPSSIRTPQNQSSVRSSYGTKFWTPGTIVTPRNQLIPNSTMKPTPPMCSCGCRAKRKFVQSPGQNIGRPFYCCGSSTRTSKKGCNFFKWENSCSVTPVAHSSGVTPLSTKQFLSMRTAGGNEHSNTPLSYRDARQATSFHILVPPSFK